MHRFAPFLPFALLGCSSSAAPAPGSVATPPSPAAAQSARSDVPPMPCLPASAEHAELLSTRLAGTTLTACFRADPEGGPAPHPCLSFDLATKATEAAPGASEPAISEDTPGPASPLSASATGVRVCLDGPKKCKDIRPAGVAAGGARMGHGDQGAASALIASLSDDKKQVAVLVPERDPKGPPAAGTSYRVAVDTYDVASGRRLTRTRAPAGDGGRPGFFSDPSDVWGVSWLGPRLRLSAYKCCGPAGAQQLLDPKKGAFEHLGDPALFEPIKGDTYLLGLEERDGPEGSVSLTFLHLDVGKRTSLKLPSRPRDEPETRVLAAHRLGPDRLLVVHANPPGVAWLDLDKDAIAGHQKLPICPPPSAALGRAPGERAGGKAR